MNKEEIKVETIEAENEKAEGTDLATTKPPFASRLLAALCQLGGILFVYCVFPIITLFAVKKSKNPFVFEHAKLALVTQLIMSLSMTGYHCLVAKSPIIGNMLMVIGFVIGISQVVAAVGALAGVEARKFYPALYEEIKGKKEA